jgi:hypothetical protein
VGNWRLSFSIELSRVECEVDFEVDAVWSIDNGWSHYSAAYFLVMHAAKIKGQFSAEIGKPTRTSLIAATSHSICPVTPHFTCTLLLCSLLTISPLHTPHTMSFRPGLRSAFQPIRNVFRQTFNRQPFGKRWQSATADPVGATAEAAAEAAAKAEKAKLNPFAWNSPVGPKTVHFWYVYIRQSSSIMANWSFEVGYKKLTFWSQGADNEGMILLVLPQSSI